MIKKNLFLIVVLLLSISASSQDIVVNKKGQRFDCYISHEDSGAVFFRYYRNETKIDTSIVRSDLANYQYNATCEETPPNGDAKLCFSTGLGLGGSTIFGCELEFLLSNRIGIQIGGGALGASAGLNFHLFPTIRSPYISLQYICEGIGNDSKWGYKQSLIGPSIVFRGRSWFTAQITAGYILDKGPSYPADINKNIPVALTAGIGAYLPIK